MFIQRVALPCLFVLYACGEDSPPPVAVDPPPSPVVQAPPPPPAPPALREPVPVFENGRVTRTVEAADAAREGLLLVDLGDEWVPFIFSEADSDTAPRVPS